MKVRHEGHSAAVCIPKEAGEISGRERGRGACRTCRDLGGTDGVPQGASGRGRSRHLPFFCPRPPPSAGVDLSHT
jgi:hypothetical protein